MTGPAPTPWISASRGPYLRFIRGTDGTPVALDVSPDNADLIVRSVNTHAPLVAACRGLLARLQDEVGCQVCAGRPLAHYDGCPAAGAEAALALCEEASP
jgi:hypothetical protein